MAATTARRRLGDGTGWFAVAGLRPLLTAERERELLEAAAAGRDEVASAEVLAAAKEARDELVESNIRLAMSMAKKRRGRGVDFDDLISAGAWGLIDAVDGFNLAFATRFTTYAASHIRKRMGLLIAEMSGFVSVPVNVLGAASPNCKAKTLVPAASVAAAKRSRYASSMSSFEEFDDLAPADVVDRRLVDPAKAAEERDEAAANVVKMAASLRLLDERSADVLKLRYGLDDGEKKTLKVIGAKKGLTRERVRQIEIQALRSMRSRMGVYN